LSKSVRLAARLHPAPVVQSKDNGEHASPTGLTRFVEHVSRGHSLKSPDFAAGGDGDFP